MKDYKVIEPQKGYQLTALSSQADIVIGGGAAGVGKTWTLLVDPLRYIGVPNFGGVIFRKTSPQIRAQGGLWDASMNLYKKILKAEPRESTLEWSFPDENGKYTVKLKFSHLQHEKDVFEWQGSEIPFIGFDELTHFSKKSFFYLMTRNRSTCGVKPFIRATCNPDPDSWVYEFIKWWIGPDGFPIREREGVLRYFTIDKDKYIWGDSYEEVIAKAWHILEPLVTKSGIDPKEFIKSLTFISGSIYDNQALLKINPAYLGSLNAQDEQTKSQLLGGNWHVKVKGTDIYDFYKFADIFTNTHVEQAIQEAKARLSKRIKTDLDRASEEQDLKTVKRCITADIALKGSDKLVVIAWEGKKILDFVVYEKSKGPVVIGAIKGLAIKHKIPNSDIAFDNDGVGQFVDGYIEGAVEFNNGSTPIGKEFYNHLKSQCYFKSGEAVARGEYYCPAEVADRRFDDQFTFRERLVYERKAVKRGKPDDDGKLQVIKKSEMKVYLNGESPDVLDAFMMREYFELYDPKIHEPDEDEILNINY